MWHPIQWSMFFCFFKLVQIQISTVDFTFYINGYYFYPLKKIIKFVEITLNPEKPVEDVKRISKFSKRIYKGSDGVRTHARMNGFFILTTPKGILTHVEAKKQNVGGELLFKIW